MITLSTLTGQTGGRHVWLDDDFEPIHPDYSTYVLLVLRDIYFPPN